MSKENSGVSITSKQEENIREAVEIIVAAFKRGGKLLIFGNGGSATQAQHMASELVWRFRKKRKALPAIALTSDAAVMTAIANDDDYNEVFSRQIEALGQVGDVALGITTSGLSFNVLRALVKSRAIGVRTILLNNDDIGWGVDSSDIVFDFISDNTATAQEAHLKIIHTMCNMIEREFD